MSVPSETQQPSIRWRSWLIRIAATILLPCLLIGLTEGGLRLAKVGYPTKLLIPCTIHGKPGSCYNLFFLSPFFPPGMIKEPVVYAIPTVKPPKTYRIFVLGESAAMGDPDPAYSFSRYLEVMLRERYPSMHFEVVNTGSVAINSYVMLPIAKGLAKERPDLFIIYSGNNEVVGPYGPGTALTSADMNLHVIRASMWARSTRLGELFTKLGKRKQVWRGMEMFLSKQIRENSPLMRKTYENYQRNLQDTIEVAQKAGARVVVSTVVTNDRNCAPFASEHRKNLSKDELRRWTTLVQQGGRLDNAADYAGALKAYQSAEAIDNTYAQLEYRIARCLTRMGNDSAAIPYYKRARDLDTLRFRADSELNRINRQAAQSTPGVALVDAAKILAQHSPHGVVGWEMVYEHVHMTPLGNYWEARSLFPKVIRQLGLPEASSSASPQVLSEAECDRRLALTPHDRIRMAREMLRRMESPPFTNQSNHLAQITYWETQANQPDENPTATAAEYEWAISQWPDDRLLHFNFGVFLLHYDRNAAVAQMRMSRPFDGFPVFSPDGSLL